MSIPEKFFKLADSAPDSTVFLTAYENEQGRAWQEIKRRDAADKVRSLASFLSSLEINKADTVAIISNTRMEWSISDLAILSLGAITVSVYPSLTAEESGFILYDSKASVVFVENQEQLEKMLELHGKTITIPEIEGEAEKKVTLFFKKIIAFEDVPSNPLVVQFADLLKRKPANFTHAKIAPNETASIVYTSGTTGVPKGVVQSHGNHLANVDQATESKVFGVGDSLFLYLPLAHSFARLIHYLALLTDSKVTFPFIADKKSSKIDLISISRDLKIAPYNCLPSVPRLFEKMKSGIEAKFPKSIRWLAFLLLKNKIKSSILSPTFTHAISGGAKLSPDVNRFFEKLGIDIYQGYGLTETCVATNVNRIGKNRIGSVGPAFKDVEVKIAADGEIMFRGPNITKQYLNRPKATAEAWDKDGWFLTGDIGHIDHEGNLYITDRKKDLIVTAGGKKIPPQLIESLLKKIQGVSQAVMCGDGKPYCVALITTLPAANRESIHKEVEKMNKNLSSYERVKKIAFIDDDFTIENGFLTPTLKTKRKAIITRYADEIEKLYR